MTRHRVSAAAAVACALIGAASASASFAPPVELVTGQQQQSSVTGATDAAGTTTAVLYGGILERPAGASAWAAAQPFPGAGLGRVAGPVVAAAGRGALALAWRIDSPRRYEAIAVAVRDPQGPLSAPVIISGRGENGVRHPAVAVDRAGHVLLAYNTGTRSTHLSMRGGIAITLRGTGGVFGAPVIVDPEPGSAPAVALADDGRGIVAWKRGGQVLAITVDVPAGRLGAVKAIGPKGRPYDSVVAAAGPRGAATVAWTTRRHTGHGTRMRTFSAVQAARRGPSQPTFAGPRTVYETQDFLRDVSVAADEAGRVTAAWGPRQFGRDRRVGIRGITSTVMSATAQPAAKAFAAPHVVRPRGDDLCTSPSLAAAAGRIALAWTCQRRDGHLEIQAATGAPGTAEPETIDTTEVGRIEPSDRPVRATLDAEGHATVLYARPDPITNLAPGAAIPQRAFAATSR
jgi:hypothetical protein